MKAFSPMRRAWFELHALTNVRAGNQKFHALRVHENALWVHEQADLLRRELTAAGVDVAAVIAGRPLPSARTPHPAAVRVAPTPAQPKAKTADDLAAERFNEYAEMRARPQKNWAAIQTFYTAHADQIRAGKAVMLKQIDEAIAAAPVEDRAELNRCRAEISDL